MGVHQRIFYSKLSAESSAAWRRDGVRELTTRNKYQRARFGNKNNHLELAGTISLISLYVQDLSWSLHHEQLYSHQNPQPPLNKFILFSTLNLLNKPRAFVISYTHIFIYISLLHATLLKLPMLSVSEQKICVRLTNKKVHWLNKAILRLMYAHTHTHIQCERCSGQVQRGEWCESHWQHGAEARAHVCACTHTYGKMFGHSFVPFRDSTRPSKFVGECMRVWFNWFWLIQSQRQEVWKVQKRRLPLNQQQLFGTFNIH